MLKHASWHRLCKSFPWGVIVCEGLLDFGFFLPFAVLLLGPAGAGGVRVGSEGGVEVDICDTTMILT